MHEYFSVYTIHFSLLFCTFAHNYNKKTKKTKMKKFLIAILLALPMTISAQDNTWERIEVEPVEKENPDAKYLAKNAVPMVDGKVEFHTVIKAPGKSADEIYSILLKQLEKMVQEPNQIENSVVAIHDSIKHELAAVFHEWLVFKHSALSLDRTKFNYQLHVLCSDGAADVTMLRLNYDYDLDRKPIHYSAEEWISDKYAVNKKGTKLYPLSSTARTSSSTSSNLFLTKRNEQGSDTQHTEYPLHDRSCRGNVLLPLEKRGEA